MTHSNTTHGLIRRWVKMGKPVGLGENLARHLELKGDMSLAQWVRDHSTKDTIKP